MEYVLLLGAKSEIGIALARRFARMGYGLILAARGDLQALREDAADIEIRYRVPTRVLCFEATDHASHSAFYRRLSPKPVGVVCAVGTMGQAKSATADWETTRDMIDSNYVGLVSILEIAASELEKRESGFVIVIGSVAGDRGRESNYLYGSTKAGLEAFLSGLRARLFHGGIPVLTVKPGFVRTRMTRGITFPGLLTSSPDQVADDVFRAWKNGKDVIYSPWFWRWIMGIIRFIPETVFKRLKL